jgi:hypothetical protein
MSSPHPEGGLHVCFGNDGDADNRREEVCIFAPRLHPDTVENAKINDRQNDVCSGK